MAIAPNILKRTGKQNEKKVFPRHALGYAGHVKITVQFFLTEALDSILILIGGKVPEIL